ncbi:SRPBCC family protein [Paraburkholderia megapolitana]|uniref:SRPBCC family protein n=1 Tax=Paraburkholderia megapolitana TaxID=420953 RepID=UPI0038B759C1
MDGVLSRAEYVEASAEKVWGIVSDLDNRDVIENFCQEVHVDGEGVGAVRTFKLFPRDGGFSVSERIEQYDREARFFSYRVFDVGLLPFADYVGSIRIAVAGPERCVVIYNAKFVPIGDMSVDVGIQMTLHNFATLVESLRRLTSSQTPLQTAN